MAEKTIIVSGTVLAFGLVLLLGVLVFGAGINMPGLDPHAWAGAFAAGFLLVGIVGIRTGIVQHRGGGRVPGRRRDARAR